MAPSTPQTKQPQPAKRKNRESRNKASNSELSHSALDHDHVTPTKEQSATAEKLMLEQELSTADKTVNNYVTEDGMDVVESPVKSPPIGSANNTWSASTAVDRAMKSTGGNGQRRVDHNDEAEQRMRAILHGEEKLPDDAQLKSPSIINNDQAEVIHTSAKTENLEKLERNEDVSCFSYLDEMKAKP